MNKLLALLLLVFSLTSYAGSMCTYYKSAGTAQEEHHVGFGSSWEAAEQVAFRKCTNAWNANTCNGYRFSQACNLSGWGCAYLKSEGTAQEQNFPGFGDTREEARLNALERCADDYSESSCTGSRFNLRCTQK